MKLLVFFTLLSFASIFYVVKSQKEETTLLTEDLDAPTAISNSTNDTFGEVQHGFKSKVGKIKTKIKNIFNKVKGGGGSGGGSGGGGSGGGGSSGGSGSGYRHRPIGYRYNKNGSNSGSYSNYSVTTILLIVFGLTGSILLITGIMYFACNKLRTAETSQL